MRGVVQIGALVEGANRRRTRGAARMADAVHGGRARRVPHLVSIGTQPATEVGVFPVQEVSRIESVDRRQRLALRQHARPGEPLHDDAGVGGIARDDHVATRHWQPRQPPPQPRGAAKHAGQHVRITARTSLLRPIRIQNARADDGTRGVREEFRLQSRQRPAHEVAIRIHDQDDRCRRGGERLIHGPAKADVLSVADQPHWRSESRGDRLAAVGRGVVDNDRLPIDGYRVRDGSTPTPAVILPPRCS